MTDSIRLDINAKGFDEKKKLAIERFDSEFPNDERGSTIFFDNLEISEEFKEKKIEDGCINISGKLIDEDGNDFGWIHLDVELGLDTILEIIQLYMKKLGKLKTVIEAVK